MPAKELETEIWARVIWHLRRPTPPAAEGASWSELHQQDLAVVSRVNSTFHSLAAEILYKDITVRDFPSLLQDIIPPDDHNVSRISQPKANSLRFTTRLHIAYSGPPLFPPDLPEDLLKAGRWKHIGADRADLARRMYSQWTRDVDSLKGAARRFPPETTLMPALSEVVLGHAKDAMLWVASKDSAYKYFIHEETLEAAKIAFTYLLLRCRPKVICILSPYGLYVPLVYPRHAPGDIADACSQLEVNTHLRHRLEMPTIMPGALNRLFVDPGLTFDVKRTMVKFLLDETKSTWATILLAWIVDIKQLTRCSTTRVTTYGLCRKPRNPLRPEGDVPSDSWAVAYAQACGTHGDLVGDTIELEKRWLAHFNATTKFEFENFTCSIPKYDLTVRHEPYLDSPECSACGASTRIPVDSASYVLSPFPYGHWGQTRVPIEVRHLYPPQVVPQRWGEDD